MPPLMTSFMTSYLDATELNTAATRPAFWFGSTGVSPNEAASASAAAAGDGGFCADVARGREPARRRRRRVRAPISRDEKKAKTHSWHSKLLFFFHSSAPTKEKQASLMTNRRVVKARRGGGGSARSVSVRGKKRPTPRHPDPRADHPTPSQSHTDAPARRPVHGVRVCQVCGRGRRGHDRAGR